jgi:hypothetical protein
MAVSWDISTGADTAACGAPQLGESRRKLRASGIGFSFRPSIISKLGLFVPGSALTPTGQVSFPPRRAARSFCNFAAFPCPSRSRIAELCRKEGINQNCARWCRDGEK